MRLQLTQSPQDEKGLVPGPVTNNDPGSKLDTNIRDGVHTHAWHGHRSRATQHVTSSLNDSNVYHMHAPEQRRSAAHPAFQHP